MTRLFDNSDYRLGRFDTFDTYKFSAVRSFLSKLNYSVCFSEQGMVLTTTYILTRMKFGATLSNDNIASSYLQYYRSTAWHQISSG